MRFSVFLSLVLLAAASGASFAQEGCDSSLSCDEKQLGAHVEPEFIMPKAADPDAARGKPVPIPLFGFEDMVRVKPGSGLWLGEPVAGGNLFLNGNRNKATIGLKVGF